MSKVIPLMIRIGKMAVLPSCQIKRLTWLYTHHPPDWLMCWYKGSTGCASHIGFNDWEPHIVYGKIKDAYFHDYFKATNTEKMGNYGHPCPKPIEWANHLIKNQKVATIIDPFMGSGTTLVSALLMGKRAVGIEISENYCDIAIKRLSSIKNANSLI